MEKPCTQWCSWQIQIKATELLMLVLHSCKMSVFFFLAFCPWKATDPDRAKHSCSLTVCSKNPFACKECLSDYLHLSMSLFSHMLAFLTLRQHTDRELIAWRRSTKKLKTRVQHKPVDGTAVNHKGSVPLGFPSLVNTFHPLALFTNYWYSEARDWPS